MRSASGWGVRGEGFGPVSIITVCERREAKGLDAHVPLILRGDALYDPDLDRFFLDLPLSGVRSRHSLRAYAYDVAVWLRFLDACGKTVWAATRDDVDAYHRERRRDEADHRITAASWNRAVASLDRLYRWGEQQGLIADAPFSRRAVWRPAQGGRRGMIAARNDAYERGDYRDFRVRVGIMGKRSPSMPRRKEPAISNELLDQLLAGGDASAAFDQGGLLDSLKKALTERALNAEMDHHLAGEDGAGNTRNGYGRKTVMTDTGKMAIDVPRDRQSSFDPQLIAKYQRRFPGFDEKIVSMYARGMSTREITGHLHDLYGIDVSPDLISTVTDAVLDEVATWQQRPLDAVYPLVFFDAIRVKIRDEGMVRNKAIHIALGVRADGAKEVLGLWLEQNEGAKFWLRVMNELRNRGVEDVLLAVVDGLKGFPEAITAVFPETIVQTCIVHLLRNSMDFVSWKDRKNLASALKEVYRAPSAEAAEKALTAFEEGPWGIRYPAIGQSWRRAWSEVIPFFAFPDEVRRIVYTTNAIEALNSKLRRAVRARGHFPSDDAATKLLYLILNRSEKEWKMPPREWSMAKAQFAVIFGERFIRAMAA
ncbi:hypothetical protein HY78_07855 [Rhizorhabdus wittichii DC-6]|nr:hypothetical protein HY78_07855 [Rhizorhabdus wittichii DC-6]